MNRRDFLRIIKEDLLQTFREVSQPFIEDNLEKVNQTLDTLLDVKWQPLPVSFPPDFRGWKDAYLNGQGVYLHADDSEVRCFSMVCSRCRMITTRLDEAKVIKCLMCERTFSLEQAAGELELEEYPVRKINSQYCLGISQLVRK